MSEKSGIGQLRSRINILQPTAGTDAIGTPITTYSALATVGAEVVWKSGNEKEKDTRATAIINADFKIRYRSDLDKAHIINFRNRVFNILSILRLDIGRKRYQKLVTQQIEITSGSTLTGTAWQDSSNEWIDGSGDSWVW